MTESPRRFAALPPLTRGAVFCSIRPPCERGLASPQAMTEGFSDIHTLYLTTIQPKNPEVNCIKSGQGVMRNMSTTPSVSRAPLSSVTVTWKTASLWPRRTVSAVA